MPRRIPCGTSCRPRGRRRLRAGNPVTAAGRITRSNRPQANVLRLGHRSVLKSVERSTNRLIVLANRFSVRRQCLTMFPQCRRFAPTNQHPSHACGCAIDRPLLNGGLANTTLVAWASVWDEVPDFWHVLLPVRADATPRGFSAPDPSPDPASGSTFMAVSEMTWASRLLSPNRLPIPSVTPIFATLAARN